MIICLFLFQSQPENSTLEIVSVISALVFVVFFAIGPGKIYWPVSICHLSDSQSHSESRVYVEMPFLLNITSSVWLWTILLNGNALYFLELVRVQYKWEKLKFSQIETLIGFSLLFLLHLTERDKISGIVIVLMGRCPCNFFAGSQLPAIVASY